VSRAGSPAGSPAPRGARAIAWLLDALILWLVLPLATAGPVFALVGSVSGRCFRCDLPSRAAFGPWWIAVLVLGLVYEAAFVARLATTPGKMAMGLGVVRPDGSRVGFWRALWRACAKAFTGTALLIGYVWGLLDPLGRAAHDRLANTRVVRP